MSRIINLNNIIAAILLVTPFVLPLFHFTFDISTTLTIVSLLFTILIGFFIAASTTDYLRLQSIIPEVNSNLIGAYGLGKLIQPSAEEKLANAIDQYMIAILDYPFLDWVPHTQKQHEEVVKVIDEITPTDEKGLSLYPYLRIAKSDLNQKNQEISLATERIVSGKHWSILILLAVLVGVMLLSLRDGQFLFSLISSTILFIMFQSLTLLNEIDGNTFLANKLSYRPPQEVFRAIGKLEYFPQGALKDTKVKPTQDSYRIGIYKNYPKSFDKEIKIVRKGI